MNTAIARARTQSGAKFCITVVIKDMIAVHAAPPNKMATDRSTTDLNPATPQSDAAKTVVPSASSASDENNERVRCSARSEEHTSELQSRLHLVCRLLLEKKKHKIHNRPFIARHDLSHPLRHIPLELVNVQVSSSHDRVNSNTTVMARISQAIEVSTQTDL